jgi:hypothetical protein
MSFGSGRTPKPFIPKVPDPVAQTTTISQQAQGAGQEEKKRLRLRRGTRGTIFAGRRDLAPAQTSAAELKQTL